jgi:hypothetical protein
LRRNACTPPRQFLLFHRKPGIRACAWARKPTRVRHPPDRGAAMQIRNFAEQMAARPHPVAEKIRIHDVVSETDLSPVPRTAPLTS